jgi:hypothetical protein
MKWSGGQQPIDAGATDLERAGDLGSTQSLVPKLSDTVWIDGRAAANIGTVILQLPGIDPAPLPGSDEVLLDAPDQAEDGEEDFPHEIAAVDRDRGIVDAQDRFFLDDALGDGEEVGGIPRDPIRVKAKKFIPTVQKAKGRLKLVSTGLICPLRSGPETMIVWTTKGTSNAKQEAQAGRDYRQAA